MAANAHHVADGIEQLRLKAIVHELPDFLFVKDGESRFVFANAATAKSLGLERASALTGKTDFDLMPLEQAREYYRVEQEIIATGKPRIDMEDVVLSPTGGKPAYRLTSKLPLRNGHGEVIGLICISRDITERKRQEHLRRSQAELLEMIAKSEPLEMILEALVLMVEDELTDIKGSVLLLDHEGIRLSTAPRPTCQPPIAA